MTIPLAVPSQVTQYVWAFMSQIKALPKESIPIPFHLVETIFYSFLRPGKCETRWMNQVRDLTMTYFKGFQTIFNCINIGLVYFYASQLRKDVYKNQSFAALHPYMESENMFPLLIATATCVICYVYSRFKTVENKKSSNGYKIDNSTPLSHRLATVLHGSQFILVAACLLASKQFLPLTLNLMVIAYNFFKNSRLSWLSITGKAPNPERTLSLQMFHWSKIPTACSSCLEQQKVTVSFCNDHPLDIDCLETNFHQQIDQILDVGNFRLEDHVDDRGRHFQILCADINQFALSCALCNQPPKQISITREGRRAAPRITTLWRSKQELFEKLYAFYNICQASLSTLLNYPELAYNVLNIQKGLLFFDFIGLCLSQYYLARNLHKKYPDKQKIWIPTLIALPILSCFAALAVNYLAKSSVPIDHIWKNISLNEDELKTTSVSWNSPMIHLFMLGLSIYRIASQLLLSYVSKPNLSNLLSCLAQGLSLFQLSSIKWIQLNLTLTNPLATISKYGGTYNWSALNRNSLEKMEASFYFMTYKDCMTNVDHLQTTLGAVYQYVRSFLKQSYWNRTWVTQHTQIYSHTFMQYSINAPKMISECACGLLPRLNTIVIKLFGDNLAGNNVKAIVNGY